MPFDYTVRESGRAKHVRFRVSVQDGLVVVVPKGFDQARIPAMVEERKTWIRRALSEIAGLRAGMADPSDRPDQIELAALNEVWSLVWQPGTRLREGRDGTLHLDPSGEWRQALRRWLIRKAKAVLLPQVIQLSKELGVRVDRVIVRCQKTRWGSYSTRRTVSLNAQLLFLRSELVRYVLVHELCHARHPNHSPSFWKEVARWEPAAQQLRNELRDGWRQVPFWLSTVGSSEDSE